MLDENRLLFLPLSRDRRNESKVRTSTSVALEIRIRDRVGHAARLPGGQEWRLK